MRKHGAVDANQAEIVAALRAAGCSVQSLASVGGGVPDLLVGRFGSNFLMEIKSPDQPPSKRRLTADEEKWHASWRGSVWTVESVEEAFRAAGIR